MTALTIRPAFPDDREALERLAQLDSSPVPDGALLLAEVNGAIVAALVARNSLVAWTFKRA